MAEARTLGTTSQDTQGFRGSFSKDAPEFSPTLTNAYDVSIADTSTASIIAKGAELAKSTYVGIQTNRIEKATGDIAEIARRDRLGKLTAEQAKELQRSSAIFRKYASARNQGAMTGAAAQIAVESEMRRVASQFPGLSEEVRASAADAIGFDPTSSQFEFLTEGPPQGSLSPFEQMRAEATDIATYLDVPAKDILDMMVQAQVGALQVQRYEQLSTLGEAGVTDTVSAANTIADSFIISTKNNLLGTMRESGVTNIAHLEAEQLTSLVTQIQLQKTKAVADLRNALKGRIGVSAPEVSARASELAARYDSLATNLSSFSAEDFRTASLSRQKQITQMFIRDNMQLSYLGKVLGVRDNLSFVSTMADPDSVINKNLVKLMPQFNAAQETFGTGAAVGTLLEGLWSGNGSKVRDILPDNKITPAFKEAAAFVMNNTEAANIMAESAGGEDRPIGANPVGWLIDHGDPTFVTSDIAANPGQFYNNKSVVTSLKDQFSPTSLSLLGDKLREAVPGDVRFSLVDGKIVANISGTTAFVPSPGLGGVDYTTERLNSLQDYSTILSDSTMANLIGTTKKQVVQRLNDNSVEVPEPTSSSEGMQPVTEEFISGIADEVGVPSDLAIAVARQESNLGRSSAFSPAGAAGVMQLMPGTARDLGLTVDTEAGVDQRLDNSLNVRAGATYLKQLLDRYNGDYVLATAAYNWGLGNINKLLSGDKTIESIPEETLNYVKDITGLNMKQYLEDKNLIYTY